MKKKILLIITILLFTCACSSNSLKNINLKTLNTMLDEKKSFVLYLTDDDDKTLKNTLQKVSKDNKLTTYYLNTIKLSNDDLKSLKEKFMFEETNIIVFVKNGQEETVLSRISDIYISEKDLKEELKVQGYLK